ncbi:hypothetical protein [Pseudonocardia sp. 73-21]|uniref:hypothetical protein n=1 Tax=Pseudonocardia sp. 73-21 TaxID=1895809 RepID=UPI00260DA3B7|nr:hypothetical protein [Pseudonocardia sp. 73-21]
MTSAAIEDTYWLEPEDLYHARAGDCEIDRPVYQGDVFVDVQLPVLPKKPITADKIELEVRSNIVMVIPHPCQCYFGDKLRPFLTVAPVKPVENYDKFNPDKSGAKDKFALPGLIVPGGEEWTEQSSVADFSKLISVPSGWLDPTARIASLSHQGLGLLGKRILGFQLRDKDTTLSSAMALVQAEWNESFLMQAWVRANRSLRGFTDWLREPKVIKGLGGDHPIVPADYRVGALDVLLAEISGESVEEPMT